MYGAQSRMQLAKHRASLKRKQRQACYLTSLRVLCAVIGVLDIGLIAHLSHSTVYHSPEQWMYGATILLGNAGGYVLVAVVTFILAVGITIVCMKKHENAKQEETE